MVLLRQAGRWARTHSYRNPWTRSYGLARSLLALGMAGTLLLTPPSALFSPEVGIPSGSCRGLSNASLFCVLPGHAHQRSVLVPIAGVALLLISSGWRPRYTALIQWWIAFSVFSSVTLQDGGDQVTAVLTLLVLPLALTDVRRFHWSSVDASDCSHPPGIRHLVATWSVWLLQLQVAAIYLDASISKLGVPEWLNGTALYYDLKLPMFGATGAVSSVFGTLLSHAWIVAPLTWAALLLELTLGLALFFPTRVRRRLCGLGIGFHLTIAIMLGLVSFGFAMAAALVCYLWPERVEGGVWMRSGVFRLDTTLMTDAATGVLAAGAGAEEGIAVPHTARVM